MGQAIKPLNENWQQWKIFANHQLGVRHLKRPTGSVYVLRDPRSGNCVELSASDYMVFSCLSGASTLGDAFRQLVELELVDVQQAKEFLAFIRSMVSVGMIGTQGDDWLIPVQAKQGIQSVWNGSGIWSWIVWKVPLLNPDRLLEQWTGTLSFLFSRTVAVIWCLALIVSLGVCVVNRSSLFVPLPSILSLQYLPLVWLALIGLKLIHESGHALACKHFGGEVPQMGVFVILLTPCAYVDATSSWMFSHRWQRMLVAVAGVYFESIAAMIGLGVWLLSSEGMVHDLAHLVVILAGVMTVLFNLNPLVRYDGYYLLSDLLGISNLRQKSDQVSHAACQRFLFGRRTSEFVFSPASLGYLGYFVASLLHRGMILLAISWWIFSYSVTGGVIFLSLTSLTMAMHVGRRFVNTYTSPAVGQRARVRSLAIGASVALAAVVGLVLIPVPGALKEQAVVAASTTRTIHAETAGTVKHLAKQGINPVATGNVIGQLTNVAVSTEASAQERRVDRLQTAYRHAVCCDPQNLHVVEQELSQAQLQLDQYRQQVQRLSIKATGVGNLVWEESLAVGDYVRPGQPLARLISPGWGLKTLLTEDQLVDFQPEQGSLIWFRLPSSETVERGRIARIDPHGSRTIRHPGLTELAGHAIELDPRDGDFKMPRYEVTIVAEKAGQMNPRLGTVAEVWFDAPCGTVWQFLTRRCRQQWQKLQLATVLDTRTTAATESQKHL